MYFTLPLAEGGFVQIAPKLLLKNWKEFLLVQGTGLIWVHVPGLLHQSLLWRSAAFRSNLRGCSMREEGGNPYSVNGVPPVELRSQPTSLAAVHMDTLNYSLVLCEWSWWISRVHATFTMPNHGMEVFELYLQIIWKQLQFWELSPTEGSIHSCLPAHLYLCHSFLAHQWHTEVIFSSENFLAWSPTGDFFKTPQTICVCARGLHDWMLSNIERGRGLESERQEAILMWK